MSISNFKPEIFPLSIFCAVGSTLFGKQTNVN